MSGKTLSRIPAGILVAVVVVAAALFVAAGIAMHDFPRAWDILTGTVGPFGGKDSGLGLALAAVGYLLLPAVIALAIADGVTHFTREHLKTLPEAKKEIGELIATALREQAAAAAPAAPAATAAPAAPAAKQQEAPRPSVG